MIHFLFKTLFSIIFICMPIYQSYANDNLYVIKNSLEDALLLSKETQQPILVVFSAEWCKNCKIMEQDIINNISDLDSYIICIINMDDREDLKKMYKVKNIPDYILIKNNIEIKRHIGYKNYFEFYKWLSE